jgi:hypothetical protein
MKAVKIVSHVVVRWMKYYNGQDTKWIAIESVCHCSIGANHCDLKPK